MSTFDNMDVCGADGCGQIVPVVRMMCSKCKITSYCSKACQVRSWPAHKKHCRENQSYLSHIVSVNQGILKNMASFNRRVAKVFALLDAGKHEELLTIESEILDCARIAEKQLHDPNHLVMLYASLGDAYRFTGDRISALEYMKQSKAASLRTDMRERTEEANTIIVMINLGETYRDMGRIEESMQEYSACYNLVNHDSDYKDEILLGMAKCHVHEARYSAAMAAFETSISISEAREHLFTKCQCLAGMSGVSLLMGNYETAISNYTIAIEQMSNLKENPTCIMFANVRQDITLGMARASWGIAMAHKTCTQTVRGRLRKSGEFVANTELWTSVMARSKALFKKCILDKASCGISTPHSNVILWLAYLSFGLNQSDEALAYLREYLDMQIDKTQRSQCCFCGQINTAAFMLQKCSVCRVSKFCNVACQRAASTKRHMACARIVVTHKTICPLLVQWKQAKRGQISQGSCIKMQLEFLKECVPFKEMLVRHTKYREVEVETGE